MNYALKKKKERKLSNLLPRDVFRKKEHRLDFVFRKLRLRLSLKQCASIDRYE